jgi:hypothetical protein
MQLLLDLTLSLLSREFVADILICVAISFYALPHYE